MANFDRNHSREEIFSKVVRAGKRTYFFDVKATRSNDYYLTITESKKRFSEGDEKPSYEKHKLFLYKEDFEKFVDGLTESVDYIREINTKGKDNNHHNPAESENNSSSPQESFSDIKFEDLGDHEGGTSQS